MTPRHAAALAEPATTPTGTYPAVPDTVIPHYTPRELSALLDARAAEADAGVPGIPAAESVARLRAKYGL
jgi:hypothetical protein